MVLVKRIWRKLSTFKPSTKLRRRKRRERRTRRNKYNNNNNNGDENVPLSSQQTKDHHHYFERHHQKKNPPKTQQKQQVQKSMSMGGKCSKNGSAEMDEYIEDHHPDGSNNSVQQHDDHDHHSDDDHDDDDDNGVKRVHDRPRGIIKATIAQIPPLSPVRSPPHKKRTLKGNKKFSGLFRVGSRAVKPPNDHKNHHDDDDDHEDNNDARKPAPTTTARGGYPHTHHNDVPHSPRARASTYSHVHDAVMYNLSEAEISKHDQTVPMGVIGLRNLGNTCFINSSLQCLSATIPLADYFLGYDYRSEINKSNFLGTGGKLVVAYAELMKQMWLGSKSVVDPTDFKKQLGTFAPQFSGYHQHDTQELLAFLLDGIHEDLNRVKERPYIEDKDCDGSNDEIDAIQCWKNYLRRNKSLVVDLFQGQLKNTCQCLKCGHINIRFEPFMYLSLPITDKCRSVDDCIDLFLKEETLKGSDQWYCEKCKKHVDATKKIDLWILPPILIVHLKRFKYNDFGKVGSKNDASIRYPISQWDLKPHVQSQGGVYPVYDLYAVSNHMGGLGGGHYTALALNRFDDLWYEFNDSSYRAVGETAHRNPKQTKSAYVLFYNRSEGGDLSVPLNERSPMIRRQSVSRPDLWPHTQVDDRDKVRNFTRSHARHHPSHAAAGAALPQRNRSGSHDNHVVNNQPTTTSARKQLHRNHQQNQQQQQQQQSHRYPTRSRAGTDPLSTYHHQPSAGTAAKSPTSNGSNNNQRYPLRSRAGSDDPASLYQEQQQQQQRSTTRSGNRPQQNSSSYQHQKDPPRKNNMNTHNHNNNIDIVRTNSKDPPGTRSGGGGSYSLRNGQRNNYSNQQQSQPAATRIRSSKDRSKSPSPRREGRTTTTTTTSRAVRS